MTMNQTPSANRVHIAFFGRRNAGKSSLMNALLGRQRAVVTEYPGTTRDFLEEPIQLAGLPVRLVDTAGLRETDNPAEAQGIQLGRSLVPTATTFSVASRMVVEEVTFRSRSTPLT